MNENNSNTQEIISIHFVSTFTGYFQNMKDCESPFEDMPNLSKTASQVN